MIITIETVQCAVSVAGTSIVTDNIFSVSTPTLNFIVPLISRSFIMLDTNISTFISQLKSNNEVIRSNFNAQERESGRGGRENLLFYSEMKWLPGLYQYTQLIVITPNLLRLSNLTNLLNLTLKLIFSTMWNVEQGGGSAKLATAVQARVEGHQHTQ